ncbi:MAG TPA: PQQ-binding-like beta-propeller repeat protein [Vitreimonas sp.]|uniref:outer membrane protein assembly factor BamB family protein n=1 Tax=Vitreimonas sp. TaxID=3069702 RepID=UPI002D597013|nr:PQQ-binding-like beta-propeller repeat protein [Vitreimonas sp.]HYD88059.1 PQQ-binding-like beta-propeller repeat protein [Vitreimonas sp.]
MSRHLGRFGPLAVLAAAAALSACSTISRVGDAINPFDGGDAPAETAPQDGRVSILTFEQQLTPDPTLAARTIAVPPMTSVVEWTQPGGTADNSPPHGSGAAVLEQAWRVNLGQGSNDRAQIAAPPVIADGNLYFLDADHRVHAIRASNGDRLWTEQLRPSEGRDRVARGGGVAAAGGRVFVTTGFGFVVALDGQTGDEVWRAQSDAPFQSAPTVAGGRVFAITNDSELIGMDANTGNVIWNYQAIAEPARILSAPSVAVDGETVVAPFASGEVVALLAGNGRRLWSDSLSRAGRLTSLSAINDIAGRPVVDNGVVYAASHSGVLAGIDLRTGQRGWARPFASTQTPWIAGDVLYAVSVDGELAAFDRVTGNIYWVQQLRRYEEEDERKGRVAWVGPIMMGGRLVLANSLGEVISVSPENGQTVATADVRQPVFIPPIAANDQIYIVTDEARLVVLR